MSELIAGRDFLKRVCESVGVDFQTTRRVVLDVSVDDWVRVYVEMIGSDRLLNISTTLNGIEKKVINVSDAKEVTA